MSQASVLMVDDDAELCGMVVTYLREDGFDASAVHSGELALNTIRTRSYDVMILDVMMPGMNGDEVLRRLRARRSGMAPIPILMLTARGDDVDRIVGLETGADDYLAKPCNLRELAARLRSILRRSMRSTSDERSESSAISVADVSLDNGLRQASQSGQLLYLTDAEFAILRSLMECAGQPVSKQALTQDALGREYVPYDRSIDVHVANLRKKLKPASGSDSLIKTIRGAGYQFVNPQDP